MLKFGGWPRLTWGHKLMTGSTARFLSFAARCRRNRAGSLEEFSPKTTGTTFCSRSRRPTPVVPRDCRLLPALRPTVPEGTRGQFPRSAPTNRRGMEEQRRRCHDTQAGVPSATRPRAQLANLRRIGLPCARRGALRFRVRCSLVPIAPSFGQSPTDVTRVGRREGHIHAFATIRHSICSLNNDPSAGSPTETLLRLLLPLNDKVQWTSQDVASGEPPTSPRSEHFTGPFNR
ncbi:hypothetical protein ZIOFF_075507 [Zingiber officinale]|uniref:Uncharacterized protein n=1 Tax=Zingiber officinale TaxID=94328 RepID=A0A8J5EKU7_ZINOF|nr:hypothetical protein ZIOFF_075507 [Zingiber officinale]